MATYVTPQYDRLNPTTQDIIDAAIVGLVRDLKSKVTLMSDDHVVAIMEIVSEWIIRSGNTNCLRREVVGPSTREGATEASPPERDIMEWWRVRFGEDPHVHVAGTKNLEEARYDW